MHNNRFLKPTVLYKEYMILDMIEKNPNVTQREMSQAIGMAVSIVNSYVDSFEKKGLIKRKKHSTKAVEYFITKKGSERKKYLNIGYLDSSQRLYNAAKENIENFLIELQNSGFRKICLYGAGEVCEMLLNTIISSSKLDLTVIAIIDDDDNKIGSTIMDNKIIALDKVFNYEHDGVLISSYNNSDIIFKKLIQFSYDSKKIIRFFTT